MRIILAIDIMDGKCVRLTKGEHSTKKIYNTDPVEVAIEAECHGIKYIHLVDLDGALASKPVNHRILEKISARTSLKIDYGGGIRRLEDLKIAFDSGADQVTCGTIAALEPGLFLEWLSVYGADRIILGADFSGRQIATNGWIRNSGLDVAEFIADYFELGVKYTICTDIKNDGMLNGPSFNIYSEILKATKMNLIASGGIASNSDLFKLSETGCEGAIIGKAVYEGILNIKEISRLC